MNIVLKCHVITGHWHHPQRTLLQEFWLPMNATWLLTYGIISETWMQQANCYKILVVLVVDECHSMWLLQ